MTEASKRIVPTRLGLRDARTLVIEWNDGQTRQYSVSSLRKNCPCASCREERLKSEEPDQPSGGLNILSPQEAQPLEIEDVQPVGSYAYAIHFSDGHNTGIFTLEHLRELGEVQSKE